MWMSFNVYFGAYGIRDALAQGAQIVVTGRCADSALVLGPLMFEYGWSVESCRSLERYYDLLASASLAGHIIECGCHATGGNFTDWRLSADSDCGGWSNVGFPIVDFSPDGSFVVTKPARTGGLVSVATVSEQLVYEIGDPTAYLLPDVIVDMSHTTLKQLASDRVWVSGARGRPPTAFFKTSSTYFDGYRITAELMIGGFEARIKVSIYLSLHILCARSLARSALMPSPQAQRVADAILTRARRMLAFRKLPDFLHTEIEIIGAEHTYGPRSRVADLAREVTLRIGVHHTDPTALAIFGKEVAPVCLASAPSHTLPFPSLISASRLCQAALSMAPGITGGGSGRPRPAPLVQHWSCLVSKSLAPVSVSVGIESASAPATPVVYAEPATTPLDAIPVSSSLTTSLSRPSTDAKYWRYYGTYADATVVPLIALCTARSGDKGDIANIGIIARKPDAYHFIKSYVTAERVHEYMGHLIGGRVNRYELPGICALNFLLTKSLGTSEPPKERCAIAIGSNIRHGVLGALLLVVLEIVFVLVITSTAPMWWIAWIGSHTHTQVVEAWRHCKSIDKARPTRKCSSRCRCCCRPTHRCWQTLARWRGCSCRIVLSAPTLAAAVAIRPIETTHSSSSTGSSSSSSTNRTSRRAWPSLGEERERGESEGLFGWVAFGCRSALCCAVREAERDRPVVAVAVAVSYLSLALRSPSHLSHHLARQQQQQPTNQPPTRPLHTAACLIVSASTDHRARR